MNREEIIDEVEKFKKTITLAEFLGWEENVDYEINDLKKYKVIDNNLYYYDGSKHVLSCQTFCNYDISLLRQAKKVEPKKYYLKLKERYIKFIDRNSYQCYLNYRTEKGLYFLSTVCDNDIEYGYQTQFTDEEIKQIKLLAPLTLDMFDKIEVE